MEQKLDYGKAWNDTVALLKEHMSVILPVAGVFLFLPAIISAYMSTTPTPEEIVAMITGGADPMQIMREAYMPNPWGILSFVAGILGSLTIYFLVLQSGRLTVGEAISTALKFFVPMLLAAIIGGIATGIGMLLLIIPGIYLWIKFSMAGPAIAAEKISNPIEALKRSWALTKGNSLYIFGLFLIVIIVGAVAMAIANMIVGGILGYISVFLVGVASAFFSTVLSVVMLLLAIAIYRQLSSTS